MSSRILGLMLCAGLAAGVSGCRKKPDATPQTVTPSGESPPLDEATPDEAPVPARPFALGEDFAASAEVTGRLPALPDLEPRLVDGPWTTLRGDDARSGLRDAPAVEHPRILWRVQVGIGGYPNTIVEGDELIWVSTQGEKHDEADPKDGVVALRKSTGEIAWRYPTESDANGMTIAAGVLYVVTDGGVLHAVDTATGRARWTQELRCAAYTAPVVLGDYVLLQRGDQIERYYASNGNPEFPQDNCRSSERAGISVDGTTIVSSSATGSERLFEGTERVWTGSLPEASGGRTGAWQPPILLSSVVLEFVNSWPFPRDAVDYAGRPLFNYRAALITRWRDSGEIAWVYDVNGVDENASSRASGSYFQSLPLVVDGRAYVPSLLRPEITVVDLQRGERLGAIALPDCRIRQFSSPVGTRTRGYLARHDGVLYQFDYESARVTWALSLGKASLSGATSSHDPLADAGCSASPVDGTALFATPTIGTDGTIYVHSGEGWVYAIGEAQ